VSLRFTLQRKKVKKKVRKEYKVKGPDQSLENVHAVETSLYKTYERIGPENNSNRRTERSEGREEPQLQRAAPIRKKGRADRKI